MVLVELFIASYKTPPEAIILDLDDTADETHGHQQLALFNAYYDSYCYQPIHIYEGSGRLITTILRPGRRPTGKEAVAILKRVIERIREAWPEVGILLRADSHYGNGAVMDYCEGNDVHYILGLGPNPGLSASADIIVAEKKQALAVPISALVLRDKAGADKSAPAAQKEEEGVYAVENARVKFLPVGKGITGGMMIEITSGLQDGQDIVTGPYASLRDLKDGVLIKTEPKKDTPTK